MPPTPPTPPMSQVPYPITGFAMCNAIGSNRHEVRQSLFEGRSGLGPSPIELAFETVVGAVDMKLPRLPEALEGLSLLTS